MDAVKLAALGRRIVEQTQQHVDRIEHDDLRAHLTRFRIEPREQPREVERARFHHVGAHAGIDEKELLLLLKRAQVPAEGLGVCRHAARILLKGDKDARCAVAQGAADQHLQREDRFSAPRAAHQQRRAPPRQAAAGDVVEALDAGGDFLEDLRRFPVAHAASILPHRKHRLRAAPNSWVIASRCWSQ